MVYRIFVEKKKEYAQEAHALKHELQELPGMHDLTDVRIVNRYDVEGVDRALYERAVKEVFSEPQVDHVYKTLQTPAGYACFAVEYLPGQFDQRAASAEECIQLISRGTRPAVRTAKLYLIQGITDEQALARIRKYVINPVEAREASLAPFDSLIPQYPVPDDVEVLIGFTSMDEQELAAFVEERGLAMDSADLAMCRDYFASLHRDPTITEIRVIDTYWSDHCRHTTFNTTIDNVEINDPKVKKTYEDYLAVRKELGRKKPVSLMDIGTIAAKYLKKKGLLDKLDASEEINACTVKIEVEKDGKKEPWLLLFKNETHNHPTEIEPFGGAATCIGGAIRDPLSGRSYVYAAMRLTGAGDPRVSVEDTLPGKLPQRKIVTTAAAGYSSYGNQIGLTTGLVDEVYHPGFIAKHMEVGAVVAAAPQENVRRHTPMPGDKVILLGGRTGRDGIGGATGSSKSHNVRSIETSGAEVQKGNAPEERKLQRLFRNPDASKLIKRCNDFGAGGVSVAIGELADGLFIDLDRVPRKYEGLDGTEIAISESQERMAVVVEAKDEETFFRLADAENLEATTVAEVTERPYLTMKWRGNRIVDLSRAFLDTNGAEKHMRVRVGNASAPEAFPQTYTGEGFHQKGLSFREQFLSMLSDLNICSKRGLSERFDSTIGAGTILMPFGGVRQRTPNQAMAHLISMEKGDTSTASLMAWGYDPYISSADPYTGAYLAVISSVAKLIASGADRKEIYLSFQEYFEKLGRDEEKWGKPFSAVLGAFRAQKELGIAAIGGKDSMSGSFEDIHVPPTLISFAITTEDAKNIVSDDFKNEKDSVYLMEPEKGADGLPEVTSLLQNFDTLTMLLHDGIALSSYALGAGGIAEAVYKMSIGNGFGFRFDAEVPQDKLFDAAYGSFILEVRAGEELPPLDGLSGIGTVTEKDFVRGEETVKTQNAAAAYEDVLEAVYPCNLPPEAISDQAFSFSVNKQIHAPGAMAKPKVLIPVFPGTNCEYDSARAFEKAGAEPEVFIINNKSAEKIAESVRVFANNLADAQMIFIPGGFSGGDEPDGSGKFITAFFRNPAISDAVMELLEQRKGLLAGVCNGFQALIKLGLVPYGKICQPTEDFPTLTFNMIGRHQSKLVRTRVASNKSPWMAETVVGDIFTVPISHGEGRFVASEELIAKLAKNGQILTQYVDRRGRVSGDIDANPNGSVHAIEGITSPDGRVIGKMGHVERVGKYLYRNVPGNTDMGLFRSAVKYFR